MKFSLALLLVLVVAGTFKVSAVPLNKYASARGLQEDLNEFLELIPVDKITDIFYEYLSEDEDFGEALDYLLSEEFKSLVIDIEAMSEVRNLLNFLQDAGLDAYGAINKLNQFLGIDEISPRIIFGATRITGGLPGFIKDVKAVLPLAKIEKLYQDKLKTSKDFAKLVNHLKSKEFQGLVDKLMANPKLRNLIKLAEAKGVDVQEILDLITSSLGIKFPSIKPMFFATRDLNQDLNDLLDLIPVDRIKNIVYEYITEDDEFLEALDYIFSEEFRNIVIKFERMPDFKNTLNYLQDAGLDAYRIVNQINNYLGIDEIRPVLKFKLNRITGGLAGFIKDVQSVIPLAEIAKLHQEKLKTSKDYANLIDALNSAKFQKTIHDLMANQWLQDLIKLVEAKGINFREILDTITSVIGVKFPHDRRTPFNKDEEIKDILEQIWAMTPIDDILDIVVEYFIADEDFQKIYKYMLGGEFKEILVDIEDLPEIRALLEYLKSVDLNAYSLINDFNALIGLEKRFPKLRISNRITGGAMGLIHDIYEVLPVDELNDFFKEKQRTNEKFKEFVDRLEKKELVDIIDAFNVHKNFNILLNKLEGLGVDFKRITDVVTAIIGIQFPERPL